MHKAASVFAIFFSMCLFAPCMGQAGDFNNDGRYDCADLDQLAAAINAGTSDLMYDLSGDGVVTYQQDVHQWIDNAGVVLGYEIPIGDINLDGVVDARDVNIFSINYVTRTDPNPRFLGWCQGDLTGDGVSDASDRGNWAINWQQGRPVARPHADVIVHDVEPLLVWSGEGAVVASTIDYEIVAVPQKAPDGFLATVLAFRQKDPTHRFTAVEGIQITGDAHQAWSIPFGGATSQHWQTRGAIFDPSWAEYDSHIFEEPRRFLFGIYAFEEDNDGSDPVERQADLPVLFDGTISPRLGLGNTRMSNPTNTAAIDWDANVTYFELAKIVTPVRMPDTGAPGVVELKVNLHSANAESLPVPEVGFIGVDEPFQIPFFARPCDLDLDGDCDQPDLDQMLEGLGKHLPALDLDGSGGPVTPSDVEVWESFADFSDIRILDGDANLDGKVNAADLNRLGLNWQRPGDYGWSGGDFNGDGRADATDLNVIGLNWQADSSRMPSPVPEPNEFLIVIISLWFAFKVNQRSLVRTKLGAGPTKRH